MLDWTQHTSDPNNHDARREVLGGLLERRTIHTELDLMEFVLAQSKGKRVLDIGAVAHTMDYVKKASWRHGAIARQADYCLGIDILKDEVTKLQEAGYNVRLADATSELDLGERFDLVFLGDVLEHVDNPINLLRFARRHLVADGCALAATPNPFSRKFIRQFKRQGTMVTNLDHVFWVTPSMALEIGRRADMELFRYHLIKRFPSNPVVRLVRQMGRLFSPIELAFPDYLFEYRRTEVQDQFG